MKTYQQVIKRLAEDMYHDYMQGGSKIMYSVDPLIAWVYEKPRRAMTNDIRREFEKLRGS